MFDFNQLLKLLDGNNQDTGLRCRFVALTADRVTGQPTGEAHVTIVDRGTLTNVRGNVNLPLDRLVPAAR